MPHKSSKPLGEIVDLQRGTTYKSALLGQPGPVLLGLASIRRNGGFRSDSLKTYGGESPDKLLLRPGDLYVSLKDVTQSADLLGAVARLPDDVPVGRLTQDTVRLQLRPEAPSSRYLYWILRTPQYRSYCRERAIGTTNLSLSRDDFLAFPVPEETEGRKGLVHLLQALDDKIAVNERIVESADELRRLSFMEFVGSQLELTDQRPLTSFAEFVNGRAFTKGATGTGRMVVRIAELNSGPSASTVYNDLDVPEPHLVRAGDVLFAWSGSLTVARWYRQEAIINQHIFKVTPKNALPMWLVYELVLSKMAEFKAIAAGKATTMGHIQRRHLEEPVVAPTRDAIERLDRQLGPLWDRALAAERESLALAELRDTLLPELMSGAIQVRGAERVVEDAT